MRYGLRVAALALALATGAVAEPTRKSGPRGPEKIYGKEATAEPSPATAPDPVPLFRGRILGGTFVEEGYYPWQVALIEKNKAPLDGFFCGGSLIAPQWVLTAAHCVEGWDKNALQIEYGTNTLSEGGKFADVIDILVHPKWDRPTYDFDIALVKLSSRLSDVQTINVLSAADAARLFPADAFAVVAGWGVTETGKVSDRLKHVPLRTMTNVACNAKDSYDNNVTDNMVCAGFATGGGNSCQGDSGGPLLAFDGDGGYVQAGVVSWGDGCTIPMKFGVYARLAKVADWINCQTAPSLPQSTKDCDRFLVSHRQD